MKTDAIIIGAELDGLVAAARLQECGYATRIFAGGGSSLHYSPGGVHVLGYTETGNEAFVTDPLKSIGRLPETHPYRKIGADRVRNALAWFAEQARRLQQSVTMNGTNEFGLSSIGLPVPVLGTGAGQATIAKLKEHTVAIVRFTGHRDFAADPIRAELDRLGIDASIVEIAPPGPIPENAAMARALDGGGTAQVYFETVKKKMPRDAGIILFPAVLGLFDHKAVLAAANTVFGLPCLEAPTLPPSIPGMRMDHALQSHLKIAGAILHQGTRVGGVIGDDGEVTVHDGGGRRYAADTVILATGGVLMGGLVVDSHGVVHDTTFGFETFQSDPLAAVSVDHSLAALHDAGIETDGELRPVANGSGTLRNVFVTGRSLAHWNPATECSADGVSIATGWHAAENARLYLEERRHG
ncbi:MAG: FAD-binding protein [Alphaproteobacteria bacterium]